MNNSKISIFLPLLFIFISLTVPRSEYLTLFLFVILVPIFIYKKYDARIIILYAISLLVVASLINEFVDNYDANALVILAFYLLSTAVVCMLFASLFQKDKANIINNK